MNIPFWPRSSQSYLDRQTIYRVQNEQGDGPYHIHSEVIHQLFQANCPIRNPEPEDDGIPNFPQTYKFGFENLEQLIQWFEPFWLDRFESNGIYIFAMDVISTTIIKGRKQLVADLNNAVNVRRVSRDRNNHKSSWTYMDLFQWLNGD